MFWSMLRMFVLRGALAILATIAVSAEAADQRFLPGDTAAGPAIGTQTAPAIAEGNGFYLAAWQDLRTSPFVGPPFATEARGFDIYVQRLDASGLPIDPAPILVAESFADETGPQIAWNGLNWLVAWGGPNSTFYNHRVVGVRIAPDGSVLDPEPFMIQNSSGSSSFKLAANGDEWLVVGHGSSSGENDFRGTRISAAGAVLNPGGTQMVAATSSVYSFNVASADGEYLFLRGNSATEPTAQRFTVDLLPIGDPFPVPGLSVGSSGTEYFFSWQAVDAAFDNVLLAQRMSVDGLPGPTVTLAGTGGTLGVVSFSRFPIGWDGSDWWVAWQESARGTVFARVTADDIVLDFGGVQLDPSVGSLVHYDAALAAMPGGGAQILWSDASIGASNDRDLAGANVDLAGNPGPVELLGLSAPAQYSADMVAGNNQLLTVFISAESGLRRIVAQRLDAAGNALDSEPFEIVSTTGLSLSSPKVGFDGTRYMVVWAQDGQTYGRRIDPNGSLIDATPLSIMPGASPDVAGQAGTFLVVNTNYILSPQFYLPYSMRVDGTTGVNLDAAPVILGQYFARNPRVIAFDGRWLATWQRNFSHDDANSNAQAAFINADGTTPGEFVYAFGGAVPDVASAGDRVLLVWRMRSDTSGHNDIQARVMMADGSFLTDAIPIAAQPFPMREYDPDVDWNGTEFVVAWSDERHEVVYFDHRAETFAARVMPDGTLLDPDGFAIGDRTVQEIRPSVASVGGRTIIAHSSFRDEPARQSYRIGYHLFGDAPLGNRWPMVTASATPTTGDVPLAVDFSSAGAFDPDGTIAAYAWDFGDGSTGTGASPSHTYAAPGEFMAQVTATDNQGAQTANTVRVVAMPVNQPPVAFASANLTSGRAPLAVIFSAAGSYDPDDGIWQIEWDFGDGSFNYFGSPAFHTYQSGGTFVATVTVTDNRGASAQDTVTITVDPPNQPPTAVVTASALSGTSPLNVDFSSAGSSDPDGFITGYHWNFGDGTSSTEPNPSHVYGVGGFFQATLTVTDNEGGSGSNWVVIDVAQGDIVSVATADVVTEAGAITAGSYLDTQDPDGVYEALTEEATKGNPAKQRSQASHTWRFDVASGPYHSFHVDGYHTPNAEGDDFAFEYSRDGVNFAPMLVVAATAPGAPLQSFTFPVNVSGTLYVRASDTDRSQGNSALDTLFVDEMFVITAFDSGGDTTPPAAPVGLVATAGDGSVLLDWADNAEPDLAGYSVYRAMTAGGPYSLLTGPLLTASAYTDATVTNGTTYFYIVTASDGMGNESAASGEDSATPQGSGGGDTMHVSAIVLTAVNAGGGAKRGQAMVTVRDDLGAAVSGALVTGSFSGDLVETVTAATDASGVAVLTTTGSAKRLKFGFCVDDVTGVAPVYDPLSDAVGCSSF